MEALSKRTKLLHSTEFKQQLVNACREPDGSVAGEALAHGVYASLVRRRLREQGVVPPSRSGGSGELDKESEELIYFLR